MSSVPAKPEDSVSALCRSNLAEQISCQGSRFVECGYSHICSGRLLTNMRRAVALARLLDSSSSCARACLASSAVAGPSWDSAPVRTAGLESAQACTRSFTTCQTACMPVHIEDEIYCRQRQAIALGNRIPVFASDTWVAPSAVVVGDVDLYDKVKLHSKLLAF